MLTCKCATTHCRILKDLKIGGKLYLPMFASLIPEKHVEFELYYYTFMQHLTYRKDEERLNQSRKRFYLLLNFICNNLIYRCLCALCFLLLLFLYLQNFTAWSHVVISAKCNFRFTLMSKLPHSSYVIKSKTRILQRSVSFLSKIYSKPPHANSIKISCTPQNRLWLIPVTSTCFTDNWYIFGPTWPKGQQHMQGFRINVQTSIMISFAFKHLRITMSHGLTSIKGKLVT